MTGADIVNIVTSVGFPILCCVACFWYINKTDSMHTEEMNKMSEAIQNNTLVMQKLVDKLDRED